MAINPLARPVNFDVPSFPLSAARADPSVFSNLASLGEAIGNRREQQAVGDLLRGATDASGNLDLNKAATAIALSGRDPMHFLNALAQRQTLERTQAGLAETIRANRERERQAQEALDRPDIQHVAPSLTRPGFLLLTPRTPGAQPSVVPYSVPGVGTVPEPDVTPRPQSAIAPPTQMGSVEPPNPEEAPPYRVAGPPMPPPPAVAPTQPAATAAPPAAAALNEKYLRSLPMTGEERNRIRSLADYSMDPTKATAEELAVVKTFRPDWNQGEYEKGGPSENPYAGRGKATESEGKDATYATRLFRAEQVLRTPEVQSAALDAEQRVKSNVPLISNYLVSPQYQRFDQASRDFVNAVLRRESGASINASEFENAYRQYLPRPNDSPEVLADKRANREAAIRGIAGGAGRSYNPPFMFDAKGDIVPNPKAPASQRPAPPAAKTYAPVTNDAEANAAVRGAMDALSKVPASKRADALRDIHERLRAKNVPPALWPQ